ncbi:hypothetical protein NQ318_004108 [Aromia moschata]|uniref:DUF4817 domain-containing protein n=1 Tax=Aromia moschata TaxID=1265417 RepID=A0AAV8XU40_9CUCU|nr:hypothetical protein NQ318_004108 [Aromia moschata]
MVCHPHMPQPLAATPLYRTSHLSLDNFEVCPRKFVLYFKLINHNSFYLKMVRRLSERERIEILIMIGYGDRARTQLEFCRLFNNKYPNREPITRSTVSKIAQKFLKLGHARDRPRPPIQEDVKLNVLLELQENPHLPTRQVAANNGIVQSTVLKYFKLYKWHPYKVVLVQKLN